MHALITTHPIIPTGIIVCMLSNQYNEVPPLFPRELLNACFTITFTMYPIIPMGIIEYMLFDHFYGAPPLFPRE